MEHLSLCELREGNLEEQPFTGNSESYIRHVKVGFVWDGSISLPIEVS